ncbi:hypothetical protein Tco_0259063, partial [Tanacetum coccineum]
WVTPTPVSPTVGWRPWPVLTEHSPIRDVTPTPRSPPSPLARTFHIEEPMMFGPEPRPTDFTDPSSPTQADIPSMEDDTLSGGFHEDSPVRSDDAPKPTADAAGGAEDPNVLTVLTAKLDRCVERITTLETDLGTTKRVMGEAILKLISKVKQLELQAKLRRRRLVIDSDDEDMEEPANKIDLEELANLAHSAMGPDSFADTSVPTP